MVLPDVVATIQKVRPYAHPDSPAANHETSTRYILIDPLLRALGWDLSDPDQCCVEVPAVQGVRNPPRVDYLLLDSEGTFVVLVEAKNILEYTDTDAFDDQLAEYVEYFPEVRVVVLTNGEYWRIVRRVGDDNWEPESELPLGLHWRDQEETASRLIGDLARNNFW